MNIDALLKAFIYLVSSTLLYPVLALLSFLALWILIQGGSFFAEWLERLKLDNYSKDDISEIINNKKTNALSHHVHSYINSIKKLFDNEKQVCEIELENSIQAFTHAMLKSIDKLRMAVRIGPSLGLIGTLIPMGTGLAALGQGDITRLSSDLVIAFTTTVVGLAVGTASYFFYSIKKRWVEEDIRHIEYITEKLVNKGI